MFKAIKEFLFGKLPEQKAPEAPYKVEASAPVVVETAPVVVETAPATPAPAPAGKKKSGGKKPTGSKKPRGPRKPKSSEPKA